MKVMKAIPDLVSFLLCHRKIVIIFFSWSRQMRGEKDLNFLPWCPWPYFSHGPSLFCSLPVLTECSCPVWMVLRRLFKFCLYSFYSPGALHMLRESHEWNPGLMAVRSGLFPPARAVSACVSAFLNFTLNTEFLFSGAVPIHSPSFPCYIICYMNMSSKWVLYCPPLASTARDVWGQFEKDSFWESHFRDGGVQNTQDGYQWTASGKNPLLNTCVMSLKITLRADTSML